MKRCWLRPNAIWFFDGKPAFWEGYNLRDHYSPDLTTITYYRYEWVVQEIADFGEQIFWGDLAPSTKEHALRKFRQLFEAGNVVEEAYQAEKALNRWLLN